MSYDWLAEEWSGVCGACNTELFAPTKRAYIINYSKHTRSDNCLGGY